MTEADLQGLFRKYLYSRQDKLFQNFVPLVETKLAKEPRLQFTRFSDHQIGELLNAKKYGFYWKIADEPFRGEEDSNRFHAKKPFDIIFVPAPLVKAYVGICFYKFREVKKLYLIEISEYVELENHYKKKTKWRSLTEADCEVYSEHTIILRSSYG